MDVFFKTCGGVLIGVMLLLASSHCGKDMSTALSVLVCVLVLVAAYSFLEPVVEFICKLESLGGLDGSLMKILMKATGVGLVGEVACMVCTDSGYSSLGKTVQFLGTCAILWVSLPIFSALLDLLLDILGQA